MNGCPKDIKKYLIWNLRLGNESKKDKATEKKVKPLQVQWLKSLLPKEQADTITIDNVDDLLPEQTHAYGDGQLYLSFMSDKWVMKMLKRNPKINNYNDLLVIHNLNQAKYNTGEYNWTILNGCRNR